MLGAADLEELHSDAGEHELQQRGDDHDVADGPDGHKHTLDHVLRGGGEVRLLVMWSNVSRG